ncbi:MAG: PQQ-like beta-propeller repeat protein [Planctomycetales bacterium]|nr:PQQ-like beta-propeller repeat protein [Planctomycetales bacterium]
MCVASTSRRWRFQFNFLALVLTATATSVEAQHWNQFRGPQADGRIAASGVPLKWSEQEHVAWKTKVHGRAWSSPVVWGNTIYLTTATTDGKQLSVLFLDADTGKVLRDDVVFEVAEPRYCHPTNTYASPTPVVEEGRLYVHFGAYGTACIDTANGKKLWERRDFVCDDFRGPGSSPIVDDNLLFVNFDGIDVQYVVALDKHDGHTVWKRDREINYGTDNPDRKKAYGTPVLIEHQGRRQLVSPSAAETVAYAPDSGEVLWRVHHGGMNAAARPLFRNGMLFIAAGDGDRSLIAVRPEGSGQLGDDQIAWTSAQSVPKRSSQVMLDDMLFMVDDKGIASCLDAATGKPHWRERLGEEHWASPILADGRVYYLSKEGKTTVVAAEKEYRKLAENRLDGGFVASPAAIGSSLLLRTATHLYRIDP